MKKLLLFISLAVFDQLSAQLTSSLTACYPLDGNAVDAISSLNGTLGAVTSTVDRNNNPSSAYSFTGSSASRISLPNDPKLRANEMSFSAWVKPVNTNGSQYIVFTKNQSTSNFEAYALVYDGVSKFVAVKGNNGVVANASGTTAVSSGSWHHVAFTFDNTSIKLYVDGVLDASTSSTLSVAYDATKGVVLGGSGEPFNLAYSGLMDNVRFYNRVITANEVSQLYSQDPSCGTTTVTITLSTSLTACYALNGDASEPISSLNGTVGAVTSTADRNNNASSAYSFTGSAASKITLPNDAKLKGNEMSFSAWVKPVNTNGSQYVVFAKNQAASNFEAYALVYDGVSKFVAIKGNNGSVANATGSTAVTSANWHHVAFTFDNASVKLYVDGALDATTSSTMVVGYDVAKGVVLGGSGETFNLAYNGLLDNVRFYNRVITAAEVGQLFSQDPSCVSSGTLTSLADIANRESEITVYPNPADNQVTIRFSGSNSGNFLLRNMLGHVVQSGPIAPETDLKLDVSSQANGTYFVEVYCNGSRQVQKLIKN